MPETINILVAVDAATLAQQVSDGSLSAGTLNSPTMLGAYSSSDVYISMVSTYNSVDNDTNGQSELQVKANSGDSIRWYMQSFDCNTDYTAYIVSGVFNTTSGNAVISDFHLRSMQAGCYFPSTSDPSSPLQEYHNQVYLAEADVDASGGTVQYYMTFSVVNNSTGQTVGYFKWDPFINVSQ